MDHDEAGRYWDANADAWTRLARAAAIPIGVGSLGRVGSRRLSGP